MRATRTVALFVFVVLAWLAGAISAAESPARTLLMVDDHDVLYRAGTRRFLNVPQRHSPHALIAMTKRWETAIGYTSVYRHPKTGKYQLWYQAYVGARAKDERYRCVVCYAESDDGITFTKPELELFPYLDQPKTNIVLIGTGLYGHRYCNSVLVDERESDVTRRYKMAYYDWSERDGRVYPGLHVAFSPDGIHWTKQPDGPHYLTAYGSRGTQPIVEGEPTYTETPAPGKPIPTRKTWQYPLTMSDAVDVMYDPRRDVFAIYGKMWIDSPLGGASWRHALGRTESKDFLTWSKPELLLTTDDDDPSDVEFHTSPVFFYGDRYFCLNQMFIRRLKGAMDVELMTSRDGLQWGRPFRDQFFIARSTPGLFDSRTILTNATPVILDDEIRFYYGAYNQAPLDGVKSPPDQRSGVGMVSIPRDRFAGIRPVPISDQKTLKQTLENVGQATLRPIDLGGVRKLTVNADAADGAVRVEVLTADGYRVRGFTQDDAEPLTSDSLRHPVSWHGKQLADLPPGRYMLRLHLQNAAVFAVTLH
ncbi:MAG: hypothetical protein JNM18_03195 [Planctomycetaceae bacterium]|nr:hypothetical protein [Planctomycetaceae bacterium]